MRLRGQNTVQPLVDIVRGAGLKRGEASRVASLFYLVPPVTALQAWWLFGEALPPISLAGMAVAIAGVVLVVKGQPATGGRPRT